MAARPLFLLLSATTALVLITASAAPAPAPTPGDNVLRPVGPACSTTGNYTDGSQYQKNLAELLAAMPAAAAANGWFYNGTAGTGADQVYGLIMCYADRNATQCQDCLSRAPAGITTVCPGSRTVSAAYDACVLRYADAPFVGAADPTVAFFVFAPTGAEVDDPWSLDLERARLMRALAREAAASPLRVANGSAPCAGAEGEEVYGMVQCTRDLTPGQCAWCLAGYVDELGEVFGDCTGGATKGYSCYVRYSLGAALDITVPPLTPPSPPPSTPPSPPPSTPPSPPPSSPPSTPPSAPPSPPPSTPPSPPPSPPPSTPPSPPPATPPSPPPCP